MRGPKLVFLLIGLLLGVSACDIAPNPENTPTLVPTPTDDATQIALLWTDTPSPTASVTITSSATVTASSTITPRPTQTPSITASASHTPSDTPTNTATLTETKTPTVTRTLTSTPSDTPTRTATNTPQPTATTTETNTPTATHTLTATFTPTATASHTPAPSATLTRTATQTRTAPPTPTDLPRFEPSNTPTATLSPTITLTATATETHTSTATNTSLPTVTPFPTSTLVDLPTAAPLNPDVIQQATRASSTPATPRTPLPTVDRTQMPIPSPEAGNIGGIGSDSTQAAPAPFSSPTPDIILLPTTDRGPAIQPTNTPFVFTGVTAGGNNTIVFASGGQYVNISGAPVIEGATAFDFGLSPQQVAAYYAGQDQFLINGVPLTTSPASEFGLGNKRISQLAWSPNGNLLAFVIDGEDPTNAFDYGVWVYNPATGQARQVFRNAPDYRRAIDVQWSPSSDALLVTIRSESPPGIVHAIFALDHDANDNTYPVHTYSQATWAPDTGSVIVSGRSTDGSIVLGRVSLPNQNYTPIAATAPDVVFTYAALEPVVGVIYFLGGPSESGPFRLYRVASTGGPATAVSSTTISGNLTKAEWNDGRNTLLVVLNTDGGRRAYTLSTSGAVLDITPVGGLFGDVQWQ